MKIDTQRHDVTAVGMLNQRKFTVDAGAHIMAVLSGLYKNPVDAMVREYLTNMYDAYVALRRVNGTDPSDFIKPILHLPTALDANLTFTDFGIGMSKDTVWNVYATYGASTKNGNNDEVGGFGLGSKTAFCYNGGASWSIESRFEGEKHLFMAFIGEDGVPNLTHVSSMPTTDHSGLTISIPIRNADFQACHEAAKKYVPYFPLDVDVQGTTVSKPTPIVHGSNWRILPRNHTHIRARGAVVMGNVPYPVDFHNLKIAPNKAKIPDWIVRDFLASNGVDLYVNVGDVDIVPSRDDLKYTDRTNAAISKAVDTMLSELQGAVSDKIKLCKSQWEAMLAFRDMKQIQNLYSVLKEVLWNGNVVPIDGVMGDLKAIRAADKASEVTLYAVRNSDKATPEIFPNSDTMLLTPDKMTTVIIDDLPKGSAMVARSWIHNTLVNKSISGRTSRYGHRVGSALLVKSSLPIDTLRTFFGGAPTDKFVLASALKGVLPVPPSLKNEKHTIYRWNGASWNARVTIPAVTGVNFYLPMTKDPHYPRWAFNVTRYGSQKDAVNRVLDAARALDIKVTTCFGIKSDDVANFDGAVWINLQHHMEATLAASIKQNAQLLANASVQISPTESAMFETVTSIGVKGISEIDTYVNSMSTIRKAQSHSLLTTIQQLRDAVPNTENNVKAATKGLTVPNLSAECKAVITKFPMLGVLSALSTAGHYGNSRSELLRNNSGPVLDYLKSIS